MKEVIIVLDDNYDDVLTLTAIGATPIQTNVSTFSVKLSETNYVKVNDKGNIETRWLK